MDAKERSEERVSNRIIISFGLEKVFFGKENSGRKEEGQSKARQRIIQEEAALQVDEEDRSQRKERNPCRDSDYIVLLSRIREGNILRKRR